LLPAVAAAAWPGSPLVNVPVCTASGDQTGVVTIPDGAGGVILTWLDQRGGQYGIYAQRISAAGVPQWTADGVAIHTSTDGNGAYIVSDDAGGAIFVWPDQRNGNPDVYAQRVSADGALLWNPNGVAVSTAPGEQQVGRIVADGASGVIVAWDDYRYHPAGQYWGPDDVFAQRVSANGTLLWGTTGVAVCTVPGDQIIGEAVPDGAGGLLIFWDDERTGSSDIYGQRISAAGDPQWTANGTPLCAASGVQRFASQSVVEDGAGGAIVAWYDQRDDEGDVYVQRISGNGTVLWATNGVPVRVAPGAQYPGHLISDGFGGAIAPWSTAPSYGNLDIYAQRISPAGAMLWSTGIPLSTFSGDQYPPVTISDGTGGAVFAWQDQRAGNWDIYGQHVTADGSVVGAPNGIPLCAINGDQELASMVSDHSGGGIAVWQDNRTGSRDVYAQRIAGDGSTPWVSNGVALSTAPADQLYPRVVSDDAGGVIVAWQDQRGGGWDIYAQQLGADGTFAGPEPRIVSVRDVPADQGGWVRIKWQASYLDTLPTSGIALYGIWRRVEESAALQVKSAGARAGDAGSHRVRVTRAGMSTTYWEGVGTVAARGNATYTFTAPTFADSTADGNPYSVFMVDAHASTSPQFWSSSPDSGYSVDNLPPLLPTPFSARPMVSGITLQWEANREHDLAGYRIYRGSTADFAPGPSTFLTSTFAVGHVDAGGAVGDWYKLAAVDVHGNASPFAIASTDGSTSALVSLVSSELAQGIVRLT
jgi:hypothetical protein